MSCVLWLEFFTALVGERKRSWWQVSDKLMTWLKCMSQGWGVGKRGSWRRKKGLCVNISFHSRITREMKKSPQLRSSRERVSKCRRQEFFMWSLWTTTKSTNQPTPFIFPSLTFILNLVGTDEQHVAKHCRWDHATCPLTRVWLT